MSFTQLANEPDVKMRELEAEIERLKSDKAAISQTASDYLHEIERLCKIEQAARQAYDNHMLGYGRNSGFDVNTQLLLMNTLGRTLDEEKE